MWWSTVTVGGLMSDQQLAAGNPFHTESPLYRKSRPAYPLEIVERLLDSKLTVSDMLCVADIGAGTGKLSLMLADAGAQVYAIEPSTQMMDNMPHHPQIERVRATGEDTGLPAHSVDLVTYAQSWHWMDAEAAACEAARIIRPSGRLAIIWNQMDVSDPWVHRLSRIMRSGDVHRPDRPPRLGELWTAPELTCVRWNDTVTPEGLLELGTTRSSYLRQNPAGRQRMQDNLRWYLYEHLSYAPGQRLELPYMTLLWQAHLADS